MAGRSKLRQRNKSKNEVRVRSPNKGLWSLAAYQSGHILEDSEKSDSAYAFLGTNQKSSDFSALKHGHTFAQEELSKRTVTVDVENQPSVLKHVDQKSQPTDDETDFQDESGGKTQLLQNETNYATIQQTNKDKFFESEKWSLKYLLDEPKPKQWTGLIARVSWTVFVLSIFTMLSQTPLPIKSHESVDPFHYMRVTWASTRGTWMEFGIMPIAASQTTLNMLVHFEIINKNSFSCNGAKNLLALLLTVVLSLLFIKTGMFGELESTEEVIISMELFLAGLSIIGLNDLVKKKYTLGTEISLFIVAKICGTIIWKSFSHVTVNTDQGAEYEGALVFLLQLFLTKNDKTFILRRAFFRQNYPNLGNFLLTFLVFFIVIYAKQRGSNINPLFKSVAPLYLQSYCVPIFILFAKVLSAKLNGNFFVNLLGVWDDVRTDGLPHSYPIGGLCYYLIPPRTPLQVAQDPVYFVVYIIFMMASCVSCSMIKNDDGTTRHTAAVLSGLCIGALSVLADFLGVFGSGTRVIAAAISIYNYAAELINNK